MKRIRSKPIDPTKKVGNFRHRPAEGASARLTAAGRNPSPLGKVWPGGRIGSQT